MSQKLIILRNQKDIDKLLIYLENKEFVAVDTETTGVVRGSEIIGYSICAEGDIGYYVITAYWDKMSQKLVYNCDTKESAPEVMRILKTKKLIFHNAVFDCSMIEQNYGISLIECCHTDTMLLAHLLDENRHVGLKDLGVHFYGEDAKKEQIEMKESVTRNGGLMTKEHYELYKADADLIAKYGAKDAILTFNLFHEMVIELYEQGMDKFFYEDETMPLLRGPTYQLNTVGMQVDTKKLAILKKDLEMQILDLKGFIYKEIDPVVKDKYPGTKKNNTFNINSGVQLAWLLFDKLGNTPGKLSDSGREVARHITDKTPYSAKDKIQFIEEIKSYKGTLWKNKVKIKDYWNYFSVDETVLNHFTKYKWVEKWLECKKAMKLLGTYVEGIEAQMQYGVLRANFLQHGTTSGRYSCRNPNLQNLPKDDKRVKGCFVARPGKVFVGADYSQLEPRVFASISGDDNLKGCFAKGEDFYSVIGVGIFDKQECSLFKDDKNSFANKYPALRDRSKIIGLATPYGQTARQQASAMSISIEEASELIEKYFSAYPKVELMMLESHEIVKSKGYVENIFGRKRRIAEALKINTMFPGVAHSELPYNYRNYLNLAMNHRVQSTGASIVNRSSIKLSNDLKKFNAPIVSQVHDSLIVECDEKDAGKVAIIMRDAMQNTVKLPGVDLIADPKIGRYLNEV